MPHNVVEHVWGNPLGATAQFGWHNLSERTNGLKGQSAVWTQFLDSAIAPPDPGGTRDGRRSATRSTPPERPLYSTCTFCYGPLGRNASLASLDVGNRIAFDPAKGCLWVVCPQCARWNLAPLEERWETVEECERRFRGTTLRYTTGRIGLAWIADDTDLIRIGAALRPEVAAWRYGRLLARPRPLAARASDAVLRLGTRALAVIARRHAEAGRDARAIATRALAWLRSGTVLDVVRLPGVAASTGSPLGVVRFRHLALAELVRPEPGRPWSLHVPHDHGVLRIAGDAGVRSAARILGIINRSEQAGGFSRDLLESAVRKLEESATPDSYFNRVLALALRSDWGRGIVDTSAPRSLTDLEPNQSDVERLALRLTGRTFWGHGGIGSEPRTALLDVPLVDRLALEMAAHEESERRALDGELAELEVAWRDADEIATIADALIRV